MKMWKYPKTESIAVEENIHKKKIVDNFRWLENADDPKVKQWVDAQNKFTEESLKEYSSPQKFIKSLRKFTDRTFIGIPLVVGGYYFWAGRKKDEKQSVLYVKKGVHGKPRVLVNPNKIDTKGITSISYWQVSKKGNFITYGLSSRGTEMSMLYVMEVVSGKNIEGELISHTRYAVVSWLPDESGFYYTRHPAPGTVPKGEEQYYQKIYFHKLGTNPKKDEIIFGEGRLKEEMYNLHLSRDGRFLAISVTDRWTKNNVYIYNTAEKSIHTLVEGLEAKFFPVITDRHIYLLTNFKADRYHVLFAPLTNIPRINKWKIFIPEDKKAILRNFSLTVDKFIAIYSHNVVSEARVFDYQGKLQSTLPFPPFSSLTGINSRQTEREFFFRIGSFLSSGTTYRFDPEHNRYELYFKPSIALDPKMYSVRQEWFRSKDGERIPVFVFCKKGIRRNGKNPTVLYGYGGFGHILMPSLYSFWLPFVDQGGILVIANIRGGGEFGDEWHKAGILQKKQNSFDDFIGAAEFLIKKKYTNSEKLVAVGGSNGGLLVTACAVQRPDLFKVIVSKVPLTDMLRFPKFYIASRWVHEYGDPTKVSDFKSIIKWSPYHNIQRGRNYPSFLFTTAINDRRVASLHAWKMAALLQSVNKKNIVLLRTEIDAGHGMGKPVNKSVNEQADVLAFIAWQTGQS